MANLRGSAVLLIIYSLAICLLALTRVDAEDEHISVGAMERNRAKSCGTGGSCQPHDSAPYNRGCSHAEQCRGMGYAARMMEEEEDVTVAAAIDDDDDDDDTYKSPPASATISGDASFQADFVVLGH